MPILLAVIAALCLAEPAFAWGPATHIGIAQTVFAQIGALPAAVAAIIARHRLSYYYGNIAADMVLAKKMSKVRQFCHHWRTGFRLLDAAQDERSQAFAYGYLSHLAADTVAHNKFVPRQILLSGSTMNLGHAYWELRADATVESPVWRDLRRVTRPAHETAHDLLKPHLDAALLTYELNRFVFDSVNYLCQRPNFRRTIAGWARVSPSELPGQLVRDYRAECVDRVLSVLSEGRDSTVLHDDPNGNEALAAVARKRLEARRHRLRGQPLPGHIKDAAHPMAPQPAQVPQPPQADRRRYGGRLTKISSGDSPT